MIRLRAEMEAKYKALHKASWKEINAMIRECSIRNYSIFLKDGFLFAYYEYLGSDYEADMEKMAADPKTREWWALCMPCQEPLPTRKAGEWWADMEEVYHLD